jgi:hypothetical protein
MGNPISTTDRLEALLSEAYYGPPPVLTLIGAIAVVVSVIWLGISFWKITVRHHLKCKRRNATFRISSESTYVNIQPLALIKLISISICHVLYHFNLISFGIHLNY